MTLDSSHVLFNVVEGPEPDRIDLKPIERLIEDLRDCPRPGLQMRRLLRRLRQAISAEVIFCYSAAESGKETEVVSEDSVSPLWARQVVEAMLGHAAATPGEVFSFDAGFGRNLPEEAPRPASAVMTPLSKRRTTWIVAVGLRPERPLRRVEAQAMQLARRIFLNHRYYSRIYESLKGTLFGLIQSFTTAIDTKDAYTRGHSERVARMAVRLGKELGLSEEQLGDIYLAGLLHDIGKLGIRDDVLRKPGKLTRSEYEHIMEHPIYGHRILAGISQLEHLYPGVRNHHEHFDGSGYPDGLTAENIPMMARVISVADAFDSMLSARPYRPPLPPEAIEEIMQQGGGRQWDPAVIACFMRCRQDLYSIREKGIGDSVVAAVERAVATANVSNEALVEG